MVNFKQVGWFFLRFVVLFVLLMIPWSGLMEAYGAAFRATGNVVFGWFGPYGRVRFAQPEDVLPEHDVALKFSNLKQGVGIDVMASSRNMGYEPTAFILALTLATPMKWPRKWRALLWSLVLANVYVAIRVGVFLLGSFSMENPLALFNLGAVGRQVLTFINWVFTFSPAGTYVVPLPIWLLVCLRRATFQLGTLGDTETDNSGQSSKQQEQ